MEECEELGPVLIETAKISRMGKGYECIPGLMQANRQQIAIDSRHISTQTLEVEAFEHGFDGLKFYINTIQSSQRLRSHERVDTFGDISRRKSPLSDVKGSEEQAKSETTHTKRECVDYLARQKQHKRHLVPTN